jgi:diguanylate cyclase (GGDEF)-like protein/PAS domain S-box-containing protein
MDIARLAGLALAYALLAHVMLGIFSANNVVSIIWPSSGLAVAALLIGGKKYWPGVFLGALAGNLLQGSSIAVSAAIACGNTLEAVACLLLLARIKQFDPGFKATHDFFWLGVVDAAAACISALVGVSAMLAAGIVTEPVFWSNFLQWWQGDVLGIILVTPLLLVWRHLPQDWLKRERALETLACFGLAFMAGQIIFLNWLPELFGQVRGYWMFLFVAWSAIRFGRHGVLLVISVTAIQAFFGTALGVGIFSAGVVYGSLLNAWFYTLTLTITGVVLAVSMDQHKTVEAALGKSRDLFNKLSQRVPGVIYQFQMFPDGRACFPFASAAIEEMFEVTAAQVRDDASAVFAIVHPEDYDDVMASIMESARTLDLWRYEFRVVLPKQGVRWRLGESHPEKLKDGSVLWHGFITDITERKLSVERIRRLSQLYKALSEINEAIVRMEQQSELFPLVCRCAVEFGGIKMAWVGQLDEATGLIVPVATHGDSTGYLASLLVSSHADVPEGRSTTGTALRENRAVIVNDFLNNPMTAPWKAQAAILGWAAAAAFPIQRGGRPFAVLTVCHAQVNAFDAEVIALLEEMSKDISFALDNFDREIQRKSGEESLKLAASVYETSSEAIMVTDADNRIIAINPAFTRITGYLEEDVLGQNPRMLKSGRHTNDFYRDMWGALNATGHWQGEIWDQRKNGEVYPKWLTINTVLNEEGVVQRRVALFTDITQKRITEQLIWNQANFDFLTELPNRQMFHNRLEQDIKKAYRTGKQLALLFIDLDRFKEVNDTLGHDMGDILLKEAAHRLSSCVRESDTVARLGGDEFTILLGDLEDPGSVDRVAQNILRVMAEPFRLGEDVAYVSASIGITLCPDDAATADVLLKNADQAMYSAKSLGRNRYSYFTRAMQEAALNRMRLANELRGALAGGQFRLFYQPIVELATNHIHKAEALIRWQHPQRGQVNPAEFIPIAEDTGMIVEIGEWVFREAAKQVAVWRASYHAEFQISVNKSPVQFRDETLHHIPWQDQLGQLGLPGQSIVVEITEGMLMDVSEAVISKLLAYRDAGIQVSLDDFGTGYSSLSYLKKFDIDYLKIDQSFTRNLAPGSEDLALCESIILMAHKLDMKVIAEGVETEEQKSLLAAAGCDYGQGYLFSMPVPAEEFEQLLFQNRQASMRPLSGSR